MKCCALAGNAKTWQTGFLKRVRDFAQIKYEGKITGEVAKVALGPMDVDR